jgi:hypothetical protein
MSSSGGQVILFPDPRFPMADVQQISHNLQQWNILIPGYIPEASGMLSVEALILEANFDDSTTTLLPDRNLITRMASIARSGVPNRPDRPTMMAANLMALAQALDMAIEPSVAFHELAHRTGNENALAELSWFRAADEAQKLAWIDVALGRTRSLPSPKAIIEDAVNLENPPARWDRNYAVALKMAELELQDMPNLERLLKLLHWMVDDFIFAGPAASFAGMYYSSTAKRGGMMKHLRSPYRERAIAGVKNAAWDITYISDFVLRVREPKNEGSWYILATADKSLAAVASLANLRADQSDIAEAFGKWWPKREAIIIADEFIRIAELVSRRPMRTSKANEESPVEIFTRVGERFVRDWRPA